MANKEWYQYFRNKTIEESNLFEGSTENAGKEFDRLFKIVQRTYGNLDLNLRLEKLTYQFITGQKTRIKARNQQLFERKVTAEKLRNFASKYSPIKEYLEWYTTDQITLQELDLLIDDFKQTNMGYLRNYG